MASKLKRPRGNADPDEYQIALARMPSTPMPVVDTSNAPFHPPPDPKPN